MTKPKLSDDGRTVTVRVPISIKKRGGRKLVLAPDGTNMTAAPVARHIDNAMVKAYASAFRWRGMIEAGACATIRKIAAAEKISETYVGRTLRLTLLAPSLVEAILNGREDNLQLDDLKASFPSIGRFRQTRCRIAREASDSRSNAMLTLEALPS
jgi:hypothetical protein